MIRETVLLFPEHKLSELEYAYNDEYLSEDPVKLQVSHDIPNDGAPVLEKRSVHSKCQMSLYDSLVDVWKKLEKTFKFCDFGSSISLDN